MKRYILLLLFLSFCYGEDAIQSIVINTNDNLFITNFEYGQMLYKNPRGIGCIKCHGSNGKGKFISKYTHKDKIFKINAPSINTMKLEDFIKVLKAKSSSKSIMPTYFLTNDEMKQIHFYITHKNKQ